MNKLARLGFVFLSATIAFNSTGRAQSGPSPYPKSDAEWPGKGPIRTFDWFKDNRNAFWTQREKAKGTVVFVGDSLIGGWKNLATYFPNLKIANRGIGGDTSRGVLFRFQEDVVDLKPKAIVILCGGNDLSAHGRPDDAISNITAMIEMARKSNSTVPIILCTIPPRDNPKAQSQPGKHEELNQKIAALAKGQSHVRVADLYPVLLATDGNIDPAFFGEDRLHINSQGYAKVQPVIQKALEEEGIK